MKIADDFISIMERVSKEIELPNISEILIPESFLNNGDFKKSNFGAIKLSDGTIGLIYLSLDPNFIQYAKNTDLLKFKGMNSYDLARNFKSSEVFLKTLGLGTINAISQHIFKRSNYKFDLTTDSLGLLNLNENDCVGMVGFFPPLVEQIERLNIPLTIIEKRESLVKKTEKWEVTLDGKCLKDCNKILITSTTILNETIDEILSYCVSAEKTSIIGPTAGFFPDPLFERGVDVVGGTYVEDSNMFSDLFLHNKRWSPATKKYCIKKKDYMGYEALLKKVFPSD